MQKDAKGFPVFIHSICSLFARKSASLVYLREHMASLRMASSRGSLPWYLMSPLIITFHQLMPLQTAKNGPTLFPAYTWNHKFSSCTYSSFLVTLMTCEHISWFVKRDAFFSLRLPHQQHAPRTYGHGLGFPRAFLVENQTRGPLLFAHLKIRQNLNNKKIIQPN